MAAARSDLGTEVKRSQSSRIREKLSHYDKAGRVRMVDVTAKPRRRARPSRTPSCACSERTVASLRRLKSPKGDPLEIARIAGITAAKRTSELIPLCHPLALTHVDVRAKLCQNGIEITSEATATGPTGVEMEALVGCGGRGADDLRHVQGPRTRHGDHGIASREKIGRAQRRRICARAGVSGKSGKR